MSKSPKNKPFEKAVSKGIKPPEKTAPKGSKTPEITESNGNDPPEKMPPEASGPKVDDDAETMVFNPNQNRRPSLVPIVLLIVAVVALGVYAAMVQADLDETEKAVQKAKKELSDTQNSLRSLSATSAEEQSKNKEAQDNFEEQIASLESALESTKTAVGALEDEKKKADKELTQFKAFSAQFKRMVDAGKLEVVFRRGRMVVNLSAQVLFDSGSAALSEEGNQALEEVAKVLRTVRKKRFVIGGHTDDRKIKRAKFDSNWELATARATVVTRALIKAGMKPWNLIAAGYSQYAPIASNKEEDGRQKNRRIEIILEPYLKDIKPPKSKKKK